LDEIIAVQKKTLEMDKELKEKEKLIQDLDFNRIEEEDRIQGEAMEMMRMAEMTRKQEDVLVRKIEQFKSRFVTIEPSEFHLTIREDEIEKIQQELRTERDLVKTRNNEIDCLKIELENKKMVASFMIFVFFLLSDLVGFNRERISLPRFLPCKRECNYFACAID
jgi:hypothetical protein